MPQQAEAPTLATTEALELATAELDAVIGGLTKIGAGVLQLSASNTYSGATTVADGTLT